MIFNTRSPIPIATTSVIGGVKIGTGLSIDSAGVLSSNNSITIDSILNTASDNPVKNSAITVALNNKADKSEIPTNVSELTNDAGYLTSYTETDPTVPSWAKALTKPTYTASEVGALPFDTSQKIATLEGNPSTLRFASTNTANRYVQIYTDTNNESITLQSRYGSAYPISSVKLKGIASPQDSTDAANKDYVDSAVSGLISQETDPVFNASAAAGISATDISNWNAKISDDKTWNSVTLNKTSNSGYTGYVPFLTDTTSTTASLRGMSITPSSGRIAVYNSSGYLTSNTPSADDNSTKVATTSYVKTAIPDVSNFITSSDIPTNVSSFNNDAGYLTSYIETDPTVPSWAKASSKPTYTADEVGAISTTAAAASITTTDINNWNAKVSDDKTWNGVELNNTTMSGSNLYMIGRTSTSETNAYNLQATNQPAQSTLAMYDSNRYLKSTTPSASDNSTKVATTEYVDNAIPKVYSSTNTSGYLTMDTLPTYDGTVV